MGRRKIFLALGFLLFAPVLSAQSQTQKPPKEQKPAPRTVWNFNGGVLFQTDGSAPGGACFRLSGRLTAPQFFDDLKRIDDDTGTQYRRGTEILTQFPDQVLLSFVIRDFPCPNQLQHTGSRTYLTRALVSSMHLYLYWKRGIDLRSIEKASEEHFSVERVVPYAAELSAQLPERLEWFYQLAVPSAGVPLTDDLVLVLRGPDGRIAARVAARL
jgi:hypothetical protein